jgi:hypothetical protein
MKNFALPGLKELYAEKEYLFCFYKKDTQCYALKPDRAKEQMRVIVELTRVKYTHSWEIL